MSSPIEQQFEALRLKEGPALNVAERAEKFAEAHISQKWLAKSIGVLLSAGLVSVTFIDTEPSTAGGLAVLSEECTGECTPQMIAGNMRGPEQSATTTLPPQPVTTSTMTIQPPSIETTTTLTIPQQVLASGTVQMVAEAPRFTFESIEAMELTREGYVQALEGIRTDYYNHAQSIREFNPQAMAQYGISQGRTVFYTEHVAAAYYNSDGSVTPAPGAGPPNINLFIYKISTGRGEVCCGVNQFIDRNAVIYWLAPRQAKLRHNYGYDGQTTGKEMEGYLQADLTTDQLEASAYLDIGNLFMDELDNHPLTEIIRGHVKTRSDYNASVPAEDRQPNKVDWTEEFTNEYRLKIRQFLDANPDLEALTPASFLALP